MAVIEKEVDFSDESEISSFDWSDGEKDVETKEEEVILTKQETGSVPSNITDLKEGLKQSCDWRKEVLSFIASQHRSVNLSDLVIHCRDGKLPAHRLVLVSSQPLALLLQGEVADIYLPDFNVSSVLLALELVYSGLVFAQLARLEEAAEILGHLGFLNIEVIKPKELKKKKVKLKVKHEKNLSSRKIPEIKLQPRGKKRVLMANLDPHELTCETCNKSFPAIYKLKIHKLTHSLTHPFMCATCGKGFNNKYKMHAHEKKNNCSDPLSIQKANAPKLPKVTSPTKPQRCFSCISCSATFPLVKELKQHVRLVHKAKEPISCIHCNTLCRTQKILVTHLNAVHNDFESGLKFSCSVCGKKFLKLSSLEDHMMRHDSVRHFACMYCPKRCATKQDLDRHLRSHSGEAQLTCQYCSREFVHRTTYIAHVRRHLGERPYLCKPCNKPFGTLNTLKKHQSSHQRKGDQTRLVRANKGGRLGSNMSYIEAVTTEATRPLEEDMTSGRGAAAAAQIYIPAPSHYIQSGTAITPLSQMQVVADFAEISRIAYEQPSHYTNPPTVIQQHEHKNENVVETFKKPRHKALGRLEDEEGDADSRDDGFILGLFETDQASIQTTLDTL